MNQKILRIDIPIRDNNSPIDERLGQYVKYTLEDWRDGRYPFMVEMFQNAIQRILCKTSKDIVSDDLQKLYGNETVPYGNGGNMARWLMELEKIDIKPPHILEDQIEVSLLDSTNL